MCGEKSDDVDYCADKLETQCNYRNSLGKSVVKACPVMCNECTPQPAEVAVTAEVPVTSEGGSECARQISEIGDVRFKDEGYLLPVDLKFVTDPSELAAKPCKIDPVVGVPRLIFMYWAQGWGDCKQCAREVHHQIAFSWLLQNDKWNMVLLDDTNLENWLDVAALPGLNVTKNAQYQAKSDIVRVALMNTYGGVWVDATIATGAPLEEWLRVDPLTKFFGFRYPHGYQCASYFLAAAPGSMIVSKWANASNNYWKNLNVFTVDVDNYFWVHHLFGELFKYDSEFHLAWGKPGSKPDKRSGEVRAGMVDCQRKSTYQVFKCSQRKCRNKCGQITVDIKAMQARMGESEWCALVLRLGLIRLPGSCAN